MTPAPTTTTLAVRIRHHLAVSRLTRSALLLLASVSSHASGAYARTDPGPAPTPATETITFFVAGDSHFGARGMEELNRAVVEQMNALPGTGYPPEIGGTVDAPRGVLFMGDMTDSSQESQWLEFEKLYGRSGTEGLLRFPIYEAVGNHDIIGDSPIIRHVKRRHRALLYSWNWSNVHFVCLDMYPDAKARAWLAKDLEKVGRERPLIVFFHYAIDGPYSDFWPAADKLALAKGLEGRNVLALFHGHFHGAGRYEWYGHSVFLPGSPRHSSHQFLVVRLAADQLAVGFWDFDKRLWRNAFVKAVHR